MSDLIPWLQNRAEDMRRANATPHWAARLDEAAAEIERQASEINKLTQQRDEHFSAVERLIADNAALKDHNGTIVKLGAENDRLWKENAALRADAERLDWIRDYLFTPHWNGVVGLNSTTCWNLAGDYRHTIGRMRSSSAEFRDAIDSARAKESSNG